ncbi:serine protease [Phytohabitans sp. ZYX-F-186]|uniref:Serine protease n=1 Tax=Phytohabitans maris TaxID=3071409 RepID=A0ABU0ZWJ3_9ACTN|nr:serine protease [Phytohabitans sp. ZYX-F-186]MDQ7911396.1 serine protease [Phytohabitans sp. ZYX-F-186]
MRGTGWLGALVAGALVGSFAVAGPAASAPVPAPSPHTEVVGGGPARSGQFPWVVRLSVGCAGALTAPRVVLTAAHCVDRTGYDSGITVVAGSVDQHSPGATRVRSRYVVRAAGFRDATKGDDWALIQLARPLDLPLLPRAADESYDKGMFTIMGWGATRDGSATQQRYLRTAEVPYVSDRRCGRAYRDVGHGYVASEMICAGDTERGGVDACQGDSGGPMVRRDAAGEWIQVGIVSWGLGCARRDFPGVYTQVSRYAEAIERKTRELS